MDKIDLYRAYFTQESKYYTSKLDKFNKGEKYSFNFWAGLFGTTWFIYRKMNRLAVLAFILILFLSACVFLILSKFNPYDLNLVYCVFIVFTLRFLIFGFVGNALYLKKSIHTVEHFVIQYGIDTIDNSILNKIREKGGTSLSNALVFHGILIVINMVMKYAIK